MNLDFILIFNCNNLVHQTSTSDLKMAGPELLKWDVHPFIMHKRASMPKCALQQVKVVCLFN